MKTIILLAALILILIQTQIASLSSGQTDIIAKNNIGIPIQNP